MLVCLSEGLKVRRSFNGPPTTLRSPAEECPVCPSSSLALWCLSDCEGERGPRCHRPGMTKVCLLLLLACWRSAARCARCYCPRRSAGRGKRVQFVSKLLIYKRDCDFEGMQQEIWRQVPLNTHWNSSPCKICVDFHSRVNSPDVDTKPPKMGTAFLNPRNKCQNTTRSVMIWTMTVSIIRLPLNTTTMDLE